ncbi:MAG: hypothetical protein AAF958_17240 [Planctomycetota bacterium]
MNVSSAPPGESSSSSPPEAVNHGHPGFQTDDRPDLGFRIIRGLIVLVVIWLIATPLFPAVARCTMRRFHLQGDSFAFWAAQFPIPAMYNFSNKYRVREYPPGFLDPLLQPLDLEGDDLESDKPAPDIDPQAFRTATQRAWKQANHFPARVITFADGRYRFLRLGQSRWFDLETSYRGQTLRSQFELRPIDGRLYEIIRTSEEWTDAASEPAGDASEPAGDASEPAGDASEPADKAGVER